MTDLINLGDRVTFDGKTGTVIHGGYYDEFQIKFDDGTVRHFIDQYGNQKYSKNVWTKLTSVNQNSDG